MYLKKNTTPSGLSNYNTENRNILHGDEWKWRYKSAVFQYHWPESCEWIIKAQILNTVLKLE